MCVCYPLSRWKQTNPKQKRWKQFSSGAFDFPFKLSEISDALIEDSPFASSFRGGSSKSEESKGEQKIFILSVVAYPEEKQKNEKTNVKPKPKIRKPDKNSTQILIHELTRVR